MKSPSFAVRAGLLLAFCSVGLRADNGSQSGVGNFHQVDANVYRGAQPTPEGLKTLADMGIKTIIDLRHDNSHSDNEQQIVEKLSMRYINVPMEGLNAPTNQQISDLLAVLNAADRGPVFVHCREGKDRTGAVVASYRIAHDHWTNEQALNEAKLYGMSPMQHPRENFILGFAR